MADPVHDRSVDETQGLSQADGLRVPSLERRLEQLQRGNDHLVRIVDAIGRSSPDFVYLFNREHRFIYVSPPLLKLWGRTLEDAYGKTFEELGYPPGLVALHKTQLDEALAGRTVSGSNAYTSAEGVEGYYEYTFVPVTGSDGRVETIVGTTRDVTERQHAEDERTRFVEKLSESEARFRLFADAMPQLAWIAQADGYIVWYNARWYDYTGTTPAQMEGWGWQRVHDPRELPAVMDRWQASIATGQPFEMTFPVRGSDGRFRYFLTRVMPMRDAAGELTRWFGTNTDVDAQRRTLAERDAALASAEEAARTREEFLSIAAHELRTPLTSLQLQLQLARRGFDRAAPLTPAEHAQAVEVSLAQVGRLARLVEQLLDVSQFAGGRLRFDRAELDLGELAAEVVERHRGQLAGTESRVELSADKGVVVDGDRFRLEQLIVNLLTNAEKYGGGEPIQVRVTAQQGSARLTLVDRGIGIAPENQQRIFERFERAVSPRSISGLGLGLYIAREIAQAHGGTISVESVLGEGSTFTVSLPLRTPP